jgi:U4/U6.U5 tri-snRNP-associated protein 1
MQTFLLHHASYNSARHRYDQFGREMTQRELWRQLNHQFHGIKPSAKRAERELESYKRELSAKKRANADTPLGSMQMLKAATKVNSARIHLVALLSL